ncbi:hypothetical protein O181_022365 [Austropuccinia psidii MF-1]|uniref:Ig-like domain-containing protein n=1 Tax=Austropuccinia psidii MF-1 TaxID=1389203 RepID=A0A9Q3GY06_9BASI|nr:hypothetical protein [Austropuccinia psidii MF-1]
MPTPLKMLLKMFAFQSSVFIIALSFNSFSPSAQQASAVGTVRCNLAYKPRTATGFTTCVSYFSGRTTRLNCAPASCDDKLSFPVCYTFPHWSPASRWPPLDGRLVQDSSMKSYEILSNPNFAVVYNGPFPSSNAAPGNNNTRYMCEMKSSNAPTCTKCAAQS